MAQYRVGVQPDSPYQAITAPHVTFQAGGQVVELTDDQADEAMLWLEERVARPLGGGKYMKVVLHGTPDPDDRPFTDLVVFESFEDEEEDTRTVPAALLEKKHEEMQRARSAALHFSKLSGERYDEIQQLKRSQDAAVTAFTKTSDRCDKLEKENAELHERLAQTEAQKGAPEKPQEPSSEE